MYWVSDAKYKKHKNMTLMIEPDNAAKWWVDSS